MGEIEKDFEFLNDTLNNLKKKRDLMKKKEEHLQIKNNNISKELENILSSIKKIDENVSTLQKKAEKLHNPEDRLDILTITDELEKIRQENLNLEKEIQNKKEQKAVILEKISGPSNFSYRKDKITILYRSLVDELHQLVENGACSSTLQEKEKQIHMCEFFLR